MKFYLKDFTLIETNNEQATFHAYFIHPSWPDRYRTKTLKRPKSMWDEDWYIVLNHLTILSYCGDYTTPVFIPRDMWDFGIDPDEIYDLSHPYFGHMRYNLIKWGHWYDNRYIDFNIERYNIH